MKTQKFLALLIALAIFSSCAKKENETPNDVIPTANLELIKTDYGGCFDYRGMQQGNDTSYYTISGDSLILNLTLTYNCCGELKDSIRLGTNEVNIFIADTCDNSGSGCICDCDCTFNFEYFFRNFNDIQFNVYLKSLGETEYSLWQEIIYNE